MVIPEGRGDGQRAFVAPDPPEDSPCASLPHRNAQALEVRAEDGAFRPARTHRSGTGQTLEGAHGGRSPTARRLPNHGHERKPLPLTVGSCVEVGSFCLFVRSGSGPRRQLRGNTKDLPLRARDGDVECGRFTVLPIGQINISGPAEIRVDTIRGRREKTCFFQFGPLARGTGHVTDYVPNSVVSAGPVSARAA